METFTSLDFIAVSRNKETSPEKMSHRIKYASYSWVIMEEDV